MEQDKPGEYEDVPGAESGDHLPAPNVIRESTEPRADGNSENNQGGSNSQPPIKKTWLWTSPFWSEGKRVALSLIFDFLLLAATVTYTIYASRQWKVMGKQLGEMQASGRQTDQMLCLIRQQITKMGEQTEKLNAQVTQTSRLAKAAENTLVISERAYLSHSFAGFDYGKSSIPMNIINSGRIPSGKTTFVTYEATFNLPKMGDPSRFDYIIERHKSTTNFDSIPPGLPAVFGMTFTVAQMSQERLNNGTQMVMILGTVTYNDGFPNTPIRTYRFCSNSIYQTIAKTVYLAPCNPAKELPKFDALDWKGFTTDY
jgi:hypothetical protein